MAAPAAEHQAAQAALAALLAGQVARLWPHLDVNALASSLPRFIATLAALIGQYGTASAAVAASYYESARLAAGAAGSFTVRPVDAAALEQVAASVKWATRDLWSSSPDTAAAAVKVAGVAERLALQPGRLTIEGAVLADRAARGWARVPEAGACAFCVMLATRGAVYHSQRTASVASGRRGTQAAGEPYHDHCRCHVEPVFTAYEPSAQIRQWQALWEKSTAGYSGKAAIAAFRQALGHN